MENRRGRFSWEPFFGASMLFWTPRGDNPKASAIRLALSVG